MKILITGGNGFIAKNLLEQLGSEYDITTTNSQELNLLNQDMVFNFLKENSFDVIIHSATYDAAPAHSTKDPTKVLENNLKMFFNLVRCSDYFKKMIYFGSGAEYNRGYWINMMNEKYFDKHVPEDQYGLSKYIMTKYALSHEKIYNLRLFAVFGKYEDWKVRIIPSLCYNATLNKPLVIKENKSFDFLYINDLVRIVKWFIENNPKEKVYNICSGNINDYQEIAEKIKNISEKNLEIIKEKESNIEYSGDNSLLLNEIIGFKFTPFDESLKELYEWYDKNKYEIFKEN